MKLAFYTPTAAGGHAQFTRLLMQGIAAADPGIDLTLVSSVDLAAEHRSEQYRLVTNLPRLHPRGQYPSALHWMWSRAWHYAHRDAQFVRWVQQEKPDVVHLQEWFPELGELFMMRLKEAGARVVLSVHNLVRHDEHFPGHRKWQAWFEHRIWRRADRLAVMSPVLGRTLQTASGARPSAIRLVPHFVWPTGPHFRPETEGKKCLRRTALLFGALRRNKGLEVFIEACAKTPNIKGIIAGYGADAGYIESLRRLILRTGARMELRNRFYPDKDIAALFAEASVAVYPYTSFASQSGALFMAVAHETPVIASDIGAMGETVMATGIGLTVQPALSTDLARALEQAHSPEIYGAAVSACRRIKAEQSVEAVGHRMVGIYNELLKC